MLWATHFENPMQRIRSPTSKLRAQFVSLTVGMGTFETENTIREFATWDGHHCRTYQPKIGLKKNGTVIHREDTCYSILIYNFPHKLPHQTNRAPHVLARMH